MILRSNATEYNKTGIIDQLFLEIEKNTLHIIDIEKNTMSFLHYLIY